MWQFGSAGFGVGQRIVGAETRIETFTDLTLNRAFVSFTSLRPTAFAISEGAVVRGDGNEYTIYSRTSQTCTEADSNYQIFTVSITTGSINPVNGDLEDQLTLFATVATAGELTTACADRFNGNTELVGSWGVSDIELTSSVEPNDLVYMCVDEDFAYVPTETLIDSDGQACQCTTDYEISCQ